MPISSHTTETRPRFLAMNWTVTPEILLEGGDEPGIPPGSSRRDAGGFVRDDENGAKRWAMAR
jgi:hypothetical protein